MPPEADFAGATPDAAAIVTTNAEATVGGTDDVANAGGIACVNEGAEGGGVAVGSAAVADVMNDMRAGRTTIRPQRTASDCRCVFGNMGRTTPRFCHSCVPLEGIARVRYLQ